MNWKNILLIMLALISLFVFAACTKDCDTVWKDINHKFEISNYCEVASDCVHASDTCCGSLVHVDQVDTIERYAKDHVASSRCKRACSCAMPPMEKDIRCIKNKCVDLRYIETEEPEIEPIDEPGNQDGPIDEFTNLTEAECIERGGDWGHFGTIDTLRCNIPTSDGGSACRDSSDCESMCFADSDENYGSSATELGICSYWILNFGCHEIIEDGKIVELCMD
jgi:hypothetical protein